MDISIRTMETEDWPAVREIYLAGIETGQATFETRAPAWERWDSNHLSLPRLLALEGSTIVGWAALSRVSTREVYSGVAEVSVYVDEKMRGRGIGRLLLERLVKESEANGIWTLQASIFPENAASISLHRACGFREVGTRERIGQLKNVWRDTVLLERRSKVTGC
jgi:L-amino acid N-acyltransferase YncA